MSNPNSVAARFGSGQAVKRVEDTSLLVGRGQFADNVPVEGATHIAFLRSPYAHAKITSIDTAAAAAMPGVIAVYTGAQLVAAGVKPMPKLAGFPRANGQPPATALRHALALDAVRFVGEAVAAVVAESREAASPPSCATAAFPPPKPRSPPLRTPSRSIWSTSAWRRARWSRAASWQRSTPPRTI
jgi:carbon-monoxide dehydrogenase large subunit